MRSNFGSAFGAALISLVILLSLGGPASASTHAELEILGSGNWTKRIVTDSDLLSAKGLISKIKYVLGIDPELDKKLTVKFQHDFSNLIGNAEISRATSDFIFNDLARQDRCKTGVGIRLAIWEFKAEVKAKEFMSALNRLSQEAMLYGQKKYDEFKNKMDAAERENAANCPKKSAYGHGYRHSQMYSQNIYHTLERSSAGLGDESVIYKNSWVTDNYLTVVKDWKCVSHTRTGGETGVYWFVGFIRKGSRVLVFDSNSGPDRYPYMKEVIDQKIDGKPFRLRNSIFPACPYPQGDVTSIIEAAYKIMVQGNITPIEPVKEGLVISIIAVEGEEVEVDINGSGNWQDVTKDNHAMKLTPRSKIITGFDSTALIDFSKRGLVRVKELTNYSVGEFLITDEGITAHTDMKVGEVNVQVDRKYKAIDFTVSSPTCTASVRGTEFTMSHKESPMKSTITVYSGKVEVTPKLFSKPARTLTAGQRITVDDKSFGDLEVFEPKDTDKPGTSGQITHTGTQPSQTGSGATGSVTGSGNAGGNLLTNPSFEQGKSAGSSYVIIKPGSTDLPGWQITGDSVDVVGSAWKSSHGLRAVDINGYRPGGVKQSFPTTPGMVYRVSFDLAGNPWGGPQVKTLHVDIPGIVQKTYQFDIKGKSPRNMGWTRHSFTFQATQPISTLHFFSTGPAGNSTGPAIDNVVVMPASSGPVSQSGDIKIESASYGANCGVAKGNVTAHIAKQCDGKTKCRYVVNHKIIGDPAYGCAKTYTVRYRCGNNPRVFDRALSAEAGWGDKAVLLECPGSQD